MLKVTPHGLAVQYKGSTKKLGTPTYAFTCKEAGISFGKDIDSPDEIRVWETNDAYMPTDSPDSRTLGRLPWPLSIRIVESPILIQFAYEGRLETAPPPLALWEHWFVTPFAFRGQNKPKPIAIIENISEEDFENDLDLQAEECEEEDEEEEVDSEDDNDAHEAVTGDDNSDSENEANEDETDEIQNLTLLTGDEET